MSDNLKRTQPEDPNKINLNQSWEVDYWTSRFGKSDARLKQAVGAAGVMVVDVEKWLKNN